MNVSLQQRVTNILTSPNTEWPVIAAESETVGDLYTKYVVILAAIPPLALALRGGIRLAVLQYLIGLLSVFICAWVIAWLGPRFSSSGDTVAALKMVAYANTPAWVAGIFNLIPWVGWLLVFVLSLYGVYLYYIGLGPVMKTPSGQTIPFMVVSAILLIVVTMVLGILLSPLIIGGAILSSL